MDSLEVYTPAPTPHLAEIVRDFMREHGWDLDRLTMEMGPHHGEEEWETCRGSWELFLTVRAANVILGREMAEQIAQVFDVDMEFLNGMQQRWCAENPGRHISREEAQELAKAICDRDAESAGER